VRRLTIVLVTPAAPGSRSGNRVTATRWARLLRQLGHRASIRTEWRGEPCDLLVALHARRSHRSILRFRRAHPKRALILARTGTDLYHDLARSRTARRSLELATAVVTLQPDGLHALPRPARRKARAIVQSAVTPGPARAARDVFQVCVLGHLRPVKDPLRAAAAARRLPASSRLVVVQAGAALSPALARRARAEERANPRYRWLGEVSRARALRLLRRCRLLVLTSRLEGGANVISEAIACGIPVVSTRIGGSIGLLGKDHPGYFAVGDTAGLAALLDRAETDRAFYAALLRRTRKLRPLVNPRRERDAWARLVRDTSRS
jgi:putative glycosyltransferase (TIGR04348 family)